MLHIYSFIIKEVSTNDIDRKEIIGSGTFGVVSRAEWKSKNLMVAVKKIPTTGNIPNEVIIPISNTLKGLLFYFRWLS